MSYNKIIIKTKDSSYPLLIGDNILSLTGSLIKKNIPEVKKVFIISDKKVPTEQINKIIKSLKRYNPKIYKVNSSEKIKSFKFAQILIKKLIQANLNRSDCVIAVGGGVVGDLSGFVASIIKRGINFVNIPSTFLAQVDSSVGGKTGINSNLGKNLIGTFFQPNFVLTDVSMLRSLPKREMLCGYGEILKHSLILDKKFFLWLYKNANKIINNKEKNLLKFAITKSCGIKSSVVKKDENEKGLRKILNFGHTFAHGFEGAKKFSKDLNHGEAVLLGMITASLFAYKKKLLPKKDFNLIKQHYINLDLPISIKSNFKKNEINKIITYMQRDKKNFTKNINLILIKSIGKIIAPNSININKNIIKSFLTKNYI